MPEAFPLVLWLKEGCAGPFDAYHGNEPARAMPTVGLTALQMAPLPYMQRGIYTP